MFKTANFISEKKRKIPTPSRTEMIRDIATINSDNQLIITIVTLNLHSHTEIL